VCFLGLLASCGGGSSDSTTASATGGDTNKGVSATSTVPAAQAQRAEKKVKTTEVQLGSPSDVPRTKGGDNSIQDYGSETSDADREAAARVLAAYYGALQQGDTETACALLASGTRQGFEKTFQQIAARSGNGNAPTTCPQLLKLTSDNTQAQSSPQLRVNEILSLRQDGERAFIIYEAGDGQIYALPMTKEGPNWRVAGLGGTPLTA
jgi:hypothetical protein